MINGGVKGNNYRICLFLVFLFCATTLNNSASAESNDAQTQLREQIQKLQQSNSVPQQNANQTNQQPSNNVQDGNVLPTQPQINPSATMPVSLPAQTPSQAPASQQMPVTNDSMRDQAFGNMANTIMPLTPEQIRNLRTLFDEVQRSAASPAGVPPKPTTTSLAVNLAPNAVPPVVRLSSGFVTSLVFLDSTGAPWPVKAFDVGDPNSFNVQWDKEGNTLLVQAITQYKIGNLAVLLKGLDTPVMVTLLPGQTAVDYRVDLRVVGLGPNANPYHTGLPGKENPALLEVLNGVPPKGSEAVQMTGADGQAWVLNNKLYVRTRLTILSPGWIATLSSADGMHAYEMQKAPIILASENGKTVQLNLQGL